MARMLLTISLLAALAQAGAIARGSSAVVGGVKGRGPHPIEKVIKVLQGLKDKVQSEGGAEQVTYAKFQTWCRVSVKEQSKHVAKDKGEAEANAALSKSLGERGKVLQEEHDELGATDATLELAASVAIHQREEEKKGYKGKKGDLAATIEALAAATTLLVEQKTSSESFLQASLRSRLLVVMSALDAKATDQQRTVLRSMSDIPPTHVEHVQKKKFKSDTVIELLKELKLKFEDELQAVETGETNALNAHGLELKARENLILAKSTRREAVQTEMNALGTADALKELEASKDRLGDSVVTLKETRKSCTDKEAQWNQRVKTRGEEVAAIETAISVLSKVSGVRHEVPANPVLPENTVDFLQITSSRPMRGVDKAIHLLRREAAAARSPELDHLVSWVAAHRGDGNEAFAQVFIQIDKMIWALREEQTDEDKKKNWCDQELDKTTTAQEHHLAKRNALDLKIQLNSAAVLIEGGKITELQSQLAELATFMTAATEARNIQKEENAKALKDSEDAQAALVGAIAELKQFYTKAGGLGLLQRTASVVQPATWDNGYTGHDDGETVVEKLKTILQTFIQMETGVKSQEVRDSDNYKEEMKDAKINAAKKSKQSQVAETRKSQGVKKSGDLQARLKAEKLKEYNFGETMNHLIQPCKNVMGEKRYSERKDHRTCAIAGFVTAKACLQDGESAECTAAASKTSGCSQASTPPGLFQRKSRSLRGNVLAPTP